MRVGKRARGRSDADEGDGLLPVEEVCRGEDGRGGGRG